MSIFDLSGKRALVTGGGQGIGLAVATGLADAGAEVVITDRTEADLKGAPDPLDANGTAFDLADTAGIAAWYEGLVADRGAFDILVNNAGTVAHGPAEEMPIDDFEQVLRVNLQAVFALSQAFARERIAAGKGGRIVNVASIAGLEVSRFPAAPYPASKGGVIQMTKDLANEWGSKGILVNSLAPGWVRTPLTEEAASDGEFNAWLEGRVPLGRWAEPTEMVGPVILLASEAGSFITGSVLVADGGLLAVM